MKTISLLGSTGSIGENTLDVVRQHPDQFRVELLTAHSNVEKLYRQAKEFRPRKVILTHPEAPSRAEKISDWPCEVMFGMESLLKALENTPADLLVNALVGSIGVEPTYRAILSGKQIALANKETLVAAGRLIMDAARVGNIPIFPIDSEHSAIWQCLVGEPADSIEKILLTASGGPFRTFSAERLARVTVEEALQHPNWQMGPKITIDSATLMNKGLEVIEAYWLYGVQLDQIEVVIHPQSIIHSMVEFRDGSIKAQLGTPDMRIPIQYALTYPNRLPLQVERLHFSEISSLTFESPDLQRFPCLALAYESLKTGGTAPAIMNAANEVAVQQFLAGKIRFTQIPEIIRQTLEDSAIQPEYDLEMILETDRLARQTALRIANKIS
ncbi:MAG: 1-deoxy-D-xylulose-5-phosphate reductoisomerase [Calditrichia bacterium]